MMVSGNPLQAHGFNVEGLRRRGFSPSASPRSSRCTGCCTAQGLTLDEAREAIAALRGDDARGRRPTSQLMLDFLAAPTRGIVR